jgi:hypothetical protein
MRVFRSGWMQVVCSSLEAQLRAAEEVPTDTCRNQGSGHAALPLGQVK